jgi:hypothetical protein
MPHLAAARDVANSASRCAIVWTPTGARINGEGYLTPTEAFISFFYTVITSILCTNQKELSKDGMILLSMNRDKAEFLHTEISRTVASRNMRGIILYLSNAVLFALCVSPMPAEPKMYPYAPSWSIAHVMLFREFSSRVGRRTLHVPLFNFSPASASISSGFTVPKSGEVWLRYRTRCCESSLFWNAATCAETWARISLEVGKVAIIR